MKKIYILLLLVSGFSYGQTNVGITGNVAGVYINEFHYDNTGTDVGEFIEVAGPAGTDLSTYTITLYNGSGNVSYSTTALSGVIDDEGSSVGAVSFFIPGIQNGGNSTTPAPDAIALSKAGNTNIQYLSYEGVMSGAATNGSAIGLNSVDILVFEDGTNAVGTSLEYDEASLTWKIVIDDTPGTFAQGSLLSIAKNTISGLKIYPNPANTNLFITADNNEVKEVTVVNVLGKVVLNTKATNSPINVSSLTSGVYMVKVTEAGKTATRKLVIE